MKLLAVDTVFEQCSVALYEDGEVVAHKTEAGKYQQSELILPMINELLGKVGWSLATLTALAFNRGPGAFSGIRINAALVQGLAVACDLPCLAVSSLRSLAYAVTQMQPLSDGTRIIATMDARQNEVYVACFVQHAGALVLVGEEGLLAYGDLVQADVAVGDGVGLLSFADEVQQVAITPSASHIAKLAHQDYIAGLMTDPQHAQPVYLRNNAWRTLAEQSVIKQAKQGS